MAMICALPTENESEWTTVRTKGSTKHTLADFMTKPDPTEIRSAFTKLAEMCPGESPDDETDDTASSSTTYNPTIATQLSNRQKKRFASKSQMKGTPFQFCRGPLRTSCQQEGSTLGGSVDELLVGCSESRLTAIHGTYCWISEFISRSHTVHPNTAQPSDHMCHR